MNNNKRFVGPDGGFLPTVDMPELLLRCHAVVVEDPLTQLLEVVEPAPGMMSIDHLVVTSCD